MAEENGIDRDEALFLSIIYSFHAAAMQQMGKIANPFTGKVERDLDAAHGTIDVLAMLQKKTEGNLSERERRVLTGLITELQLNFVDESKRGPAPAEGEGEAAAEPAGEAGKAGEKAGAAEPGAAEAEKQAEEEPAKEEAEKAEASEEKEKQEKETEERG